MWLLCITAIVILLFEPTLSNGTIPLDKGHQNILCWLYIEFKTAELFEFFIVWMSFERIKLKIEIVNRPKILSSKILKSAETVRAFESTLEMCAEIVFDVAPHIQHNWINDIVVTLATVLDCHDGLSYLEINIFNLPNLVIHAQKKMCSPKLVKLPRKTALRLWFINLENGKSQKRGYARHYILPTWGLLVGPPRSVTVYEQITTFVKIKSQQ